MDNTQNNLNKKLADMVTDSGGRLLDGWDAGLALDRIAEKIKNLIDDGADPNVGHWYFGEPLIFLATRYRQIAIMQALLDGGAHVDTHNTRRETSVHWALRKACEGKDTQSAAATLIRNGAHLDIPDVYGQSCHDYLNYLKSTKNIKPDLLYALKEKGAKIDNDDVFSPLRKIENGLNNLGRRISNNVTRWVTADIVRLLGLHPPF
jgi:ankyrin repeat protein